MTYDVDNQSLARSPSLSGSSCSQRSPTSVHKLEMTSPFRPLHSASPVGLAVIQEPPCEVPDPPGLTPMQVTVAPSLTQTHSACAPFHTNVMPWPTSHVVWAVPSKVVPVTPISSGRPQAGAGVPVFNFVSPPGVCWPSTVIPQPSIPVPVNEIPACPQFSAATHLSGHYTQLAHTILSPSNSESLASSSTTQILKKSFLKHTDHGLNDNDSTSSGDDGQSKLSWQDDCESEMSQQSLAVHGRHTSPALQYENDESEEVNVDEIGSRTGFESPELPGSGNIPLQEMRDFAMHFKERRTKLGYTQADVGLELRGVYGMEFSQATICRFESLSLSYENLCRWKVKLENWLMLAESRGPQWSSSGSSLCSVRRAKQRRRTMIGPAEKNALVQFFERNPRPRSEEVEELARCLHLESKVIKTWLGNYRQKVRRLHAFQQLDGVRGPAAKQEEDEDEGNE